MECDELNKKMYRVDPRKSNFGVLVLEKVATPCSELCAARTRNLVRYEVNFPALLSSLCTRIRVFFRKWCRYQKPWLPPQMVVFEGVQRGVEFGAGHRFEESGRQSQIFLRRDFNVQPRPAHRRHGVTLLFGQLRFIGRL